MEQNRRCGWKASAVNDRDLISPSPPLGLDVLSYRPRFVLAVGFQHAIDFVVLHQSAGVEPDGFVAEPADHRVGVRGDDENAGAIDEALQAGRGLVEELRVADPDRFVEEKDLRLAYGHDR